MAFDQSTRTRLQRFVSEARTLLTEECTRQLQHEYGMNPATGEVVELSKLPPLDNTRLETARLLRDTLAHYLATSPSGGRTEALRRIVREQAFTVLNRLVALRMMESRGLLLESIARGYQTRGFQLYQRLAGASLGETGDAYRCYLVSLFDEFALGLAVLFDRFSPQGRLFPREAALLALLNLLNHPDIEALWAEDETIGWIYQYYNSQEERRQMRADSPAPRNSRELAVRNQFFTPRYVVEFLTDNTLGRLWYEMTQGRTTLTDQCRYLVRRPQELFLQPGEEPPAQAEPQKELSQEELLQQPVHIPFRALKDPRDIRMLDPACGSMHFGLYAFDLFEVIYDEAWEIAHSSAEAQQSSASFVPFVSFVVQYSDKAAFLADVPRLIIEHNLHGIDIDPRATQIAGLSLWLRAQRTWQQQGLRPQDRPRIRRSNIVCAEPMPGEEAFLEEFIEAHLPATPEYKLLGRLVRRVFDAMQLAGEVGSLLKIEEEIAGAVAEARQKWLADTKPEQGRLFPDGTAPPTQKERGLDVTGITDETFWEQAEERIYTALQTYAEQAEYGGYQRRLFADDASRGFAFIDLCRKRYDVVVMNPPFGDASLPSKPYIEDVYADTKGDVYKAFIECFQDRLVPAGMFGIISSRTGFFLGQSADWRKRIVLRLYHPVALADLGSGVLDAMVETAAYVLRTLSNAEDRQLTLRLLPEVLEVPTDKDGCFSIPKYQQKRNGLKRHQAKGEIGRLLQAGYVTEVPGHFRRFKPQNTSIRSAHAPQPESFDKLMCFRLVDVEDKGNQLAEAMQSLPLAQTNRLIHIVNPMSFSQVPGSPFAYWVSERIRRLFTELRPFEFPGREVRVGDHPGDSFRYLRLFWEIPTTPQMRNWRLYQKGGDYSPYYFDIHLVADWDADRQTYRGFHGRPGRPTERPSNYQYFFRPGLSWPLRTQRGLALRVLPSSCIFSHKGPTVFVDNNNADDLLALLAIANSLLFRQLVSLQMTFGSYEVGVIQRTPIPDFTPETAQCLANLTRWAWSLKWGLDTASEASHAFILPTLLQVTGESLSARSRAWDERVRAADEQLARIQAEIDECAFNLYGVYNSDRQNMLETLHHTGEAGEATDNDDEDNEEITQADAPALVAQLLSYDMGLVFGRFDLDLALGRSSLPPEPDPFAPLPVCPPGQLQNEQGLPITKEDVSRLKEEGRWHYPLGIPWGGILVDDPGHPLDLEARVHQVLQIIWKDSWEAIEREACEILGVRTLRDYFRKPADFFADHLKRYSKSRRKAPIYWPLQTQSGSYTLWLYYHRLNDQTLYTCVNDFIEKSKLREVTEQLNVLRTKTSRSKQEENNLERLLDLEQELKNFRDELLRVAEFWKPNLNDGVQITAAPLWKLFQHRPWQNTLKDTWEKLEHGDYDWAHLAYSIWPDRVREKCRHDKSLAIAHGLEELYEAPPEQPKKKRGRARG